MVRVLFNGIETLPLQRVEIVLLKHHLEMQLGLLQGTYKDLSACYVSFVYSRRYGITTDIVVGYQDGTAYGHGEASTVLESVEQALHQLHHAYEPADHIA
jgi:hypothetical protein